MITLSILPNFKGTKKATAEALFICVILDAVMILFAVGM